MASKPSLLVVFACFLLIATKATCIHEEHIAMDPPDCDDDESPTPSPTPTPPAYVTPPTTTPSSPTPSPPSYSPPPLPATDPVPPPAPLPPTYKPPTVPVTPSPTQPPSVSPPSYSTPSPSSGPPGPRSHNGYCVPRCQQRCKIYSRRMRPCVRLCTKCCEVNNRCVPLGSETCPNWNTVVYHGETRNCP